MIKTICFDLDGVLFLNGKANFINSIVDMGVPEDEVKRVFLKSNEMNEMYKRGKMSDDEYWSYAIKEWKLSLSVQEIIDLLIRGYETNDLAFEYVKKVRMAGYKTAICSNNFPAKISGLQKRFGFLNDFDTVVISYEVGSVKPEKEIFEKLIDKSGVQAEEIFYSDDDESKLAGAKELGIQTSVYTTFEAFVTELQKSGVII